MRPANYAVELQVQLDSEETLPLERIQQAVTWVLNRHTQPDGTELSIVIMDDESVRQMNRQFRDVDKPTDVLSFPADAPAITDAAENYLGDLILALPYIQRQALSEQHTWQDDMVLAVIHGTLHLLGYDHDTPDNQRAMWSVQADALTALDVAITVPLFEFDDDEGD